jgi:hypothetical protein
LDELLSDRIRLTDLDPALAALDNPIGARALVEFN